MINLIHYPDTNSVEVTWLDAENKQTRCHSYADVQMDMLIADLGDAAAEYADLISAVRAGIPSTEGYQEYAQYLVWLSEGNTPPPPPKQFTSLEYLDLFTESEQLAVVSATMAVPHVKLWYDKMLAAGFITTADPRTEGGLSALVGAGLLTEDRKVEILGAMQ